MIETMASNSISEEDLMILKMKTVLNFPVDSRVEFVARFGFVFEILGCQLKIDEDQNADLTSVSENFKLTILGEANNLIRNLDEKSAAECMSNQGFRRLLAFSISLIIKLTQDKYNEVKLRAVRLLLSFIKVLGPSSPRVFAYFLPGISIGLVKTLTHDEKINREVVIECLNTLSTIICLCIDGDPSQDAESDQQFSIKRTDEWLKESIEKINIIVEKTVKTLLVHYAAEVRQKLILFARSIIIDFALKLKNHNQKLILTSLQVPLVLINDEFTEVQNDALNLIRDLDDVITYGQLNDDLQDAFYKFLTALPRQILFSTSEKQLIQLRLMEGYLRCLSSSGLNRFLSCFEYRQRLFHCLIDLCQFNSRGFRIDDRLSHVIDDDYNSELDRISIERDQFPTKCLKVIVDPKCVQQLISSMRVIGELAEPHLLVDHFQEIFDAKVNPVLLLIFTSVITGFSDNEIIRSLLHQFIIVLMKIKEERLEPNFNTVMSKCLFLEGFIELARKAGIEERNSVLMNALCPLLIESCSSQSLIAVTSLICLKRLCKIYFYTSLRSLISDNVDYIGNYFNIGIRSFRLDRKLSLVMMAVLNLTDTDLLPLLEVFFEKVFVTLDTYNNEDCVELVDVLFTVVNHIFVRSSFKFIEENCSTDIGPIQLMSKEEFVDNLRKLNEASEVVENMDFEEEPDKGLEKFKEMYERKDEDILEDITAGNLGDKEKDPLPYHIEFVKTVLQRCCHLISSQSTVTRLKIMELVMRGMKILEQYEDEILPIAHILWTPLVYRLREGEPLIMKKGFTCFLIMLETCRDFLRCRSSREVFPSLLSFLNSTWRQSQHKTDRSPYKFTMDFQLQQKMLSSVGRICEYLQLETLHLWAFIEVLVRYLTSEQPKLLVNASISSLRRIYSIDPFSVHYYLRKSDRNNLICQNLDAKFISKMSKS